MNSKKIVSSLLALALVSSAGAVFAAESKDAAKPVNAKITQACKKEFGNDKAKIKTCVEEKTHAQASGQAPASGPAAR